MHEGRMEAMHISESNSHGRIHICTCTISFWARGQATAAPHFLRVGNLTRAVVACVT
jgi:hypothetical protein